MIPVDSVGAFVGAPSLLAAGRPDGPLAGVRVAVKDAIDVAGSVTGAGNPTFAAGRPAAVAHASVVQRLLDAGASVVGKAVLDELAYSLAGRNVHFGTPVNTAAPGRLPGGSSSGCAAAVAAGLTELGLGTDTGGSIRVPASFCGLYGWRPTHGAVPVDGVVPLAPSFDTVGLLAADPALLRTAAEVLLGTFGSDANHLRSVVRWEVVVPDLALDLIEAAEAFRVLQAREAWAAHGAWIERAEPGFAPDVAARFAAASKITDDEVAAAQLVRAEVKAALDDVLADGTVLVLPAAAGPPPPVDVGAADLDEFRRATMQLTSPIGLAGLPAVVIPGTGLDGLPLGTAYVAARGTDLALIDLATGGE